jgi:hypothetical protein
VHEIRSFNLICRPFACYTFFGYDNVVLYPCVHCTFFGFLLLHRLPHLLAKGVDGFLGGQSLEDNYHVGYVVTGHHGALLERTDLPNFLDLLKADCKKLTSVKAFSSISKKVVH